MISCYFNIISYGLRNGGGIGDAAIFENFKNSLPYHTRFLYTATFQLVINIAMLNIVFGIIIDTFAVLREEEEQKKNDMYNNCFICSFDRDTLDKKSDTKKGFLFHIYVVYSDFRLSTICGIIYSSLLI